MWAFRGTKECSKLQASLDCHSASLSLQQSIARRFERTLQNAQRHDDETDGETPRGNETFLKDMLGEMESLMAKIAGKIDHCGSGEFHS